MELEERPALLQSGKGHGSLYMCARVLGRVWYGGGLKNDDLGVLLGENLRKALRVSCGFFLIVCSKKCQKRKMN